MHNDVKIITLDASGWCSALDLYEDLLGALGAPDWHGRNVNALIDSMIYGGINAVEPPFRIEISGLERADYDALEELKAAMGFLAEEGADCSVSDGVAAIEVALPA